MFPARLLGRGDLCRVDVTYCCLLVRDVSPPKSIVQFITAANGLLPEAMLPPIKKRQDRPGLNCDELEVVPRRQVSELGLLTMVAQIEMVDIGPSSADVPVEEDE
jgi:hypothetical protein